MRAGGGGDIHRSDRAGFWVGEGLEEKRIGGKSWPWSGELWCFRSLVDAGHSLLSFRLAVMGRVCLLEA